MKENKNPSLEILTKKGLTKLEADIFLSLHKKIESLSAEEKIKEEESAKDSGILHKIKKTSLFLLERATAPTPKFWKKTRNYMLAVGGASTVIVLSGSFLPVIIVKIASYGITTGAIGTALSQLAKVREE